MRKPLAASLLTLLIASSSCGDDRAAVPDVARSVHGAVRDGLDGKPLGAVRVHFVSDTLDEAATKTDSDGTYRVAVLTDTSKGRLEAAKDGYTTRVVSVFFDSHDVNLDIALSPASAGE